MKQHYELWLDESGEFENEAAQKQKHRNPSLIGGILLTPAILDKVLYTELLGDSIGHACKMIELDKIEIILPALEKLQALGARQVFFENTEYEDASTNRQLYLRMMAEGLVQLLQTLNATNESVSLHVVIAQRQDVRAPVGAQRIQANEYTAALNRCMLQKRKERHIVLDEDTTLTFEVQVANSTEKLMLADFACNTRLTRKCAALRQEEARVAQLYNDAYLFTLHERGTEQYIKTALSQGDISDAIIELYTTADQIEEQTLLQMIQQRMQTMGYRLIQAQLEQCCAELVAYASKLEDFEIGEAFLKKLNVALIPFLKQNDCYPEKLQFELLLLLAHMYLREGDTAEAKRVLAECRAAHLAIGSSLEELFSYYQLLEKEALLCINELDFTAAADQMEHACNSLLSIMRAIEGNGDLNTRFSSLKSEHVGEALRIKIYALMFLQRTTPALYDELCDLSDKAMAQYVGSKSKLERHRQYRAFIACEANKFSEALQWLFLSKCYPIDTQDSNHIVGFLNDIYQSEAQASCEYYMMCYLHIMAQAAHEADPLAKVMYQALHQQQSLLTAMGLNEPPAHEQEIDLSEVQLPATNIQYHPIENIYWKYASYFFANKNYKKADVYYNKAIEVCTRQKNYTTMRLRCVAILAESTVASIEEQEYSTAQHKSTKLKKQIAELQKENLSTAAQAFLARAVLLTNKNSDRKGIINGNALWQLSRLITY